MDRVYNFSAGPAVMPVTVLQKIQKELLSYQDSGMSVMELSHRSSLFQSILNDAESLLRELMDIPSNYEVLFLQGGASLQFTMLPMNLGKAKVAYVNTGSWSQKAIEEAEKINGLTVEVIASSKENQFSKNPVVPLVDETFDYVHITTNNTIEGTAFLDVPTSGDIPLVADMSSNILSSSYKVSDFGLIYAGAQKNIGPSGLTVVIVRKDLIGLKENLPAMLDYKVQADNGSMYNTPPTFAIYAAKLMFEWLQELGGVAEIEKLNRKKAAMLYETIEASKLYRSPVDKGSRSLTNIPFVTGDAEMDKLFIKQAENKGMINLKGHRSVGGMRASLYNAFPLEGVEELINFMKEFEAKVKGD
ncbi:phosphoserine aminotransferase [Carnobacterium sp. AT7]|uniref:3-phosphoserine/phosphohydroxythreonine transaminase n=1 Tax=Carnobacterium TaxID=2747 RepID=UPI00015F1D7C|nr:3-phosphoserine/phosphohydroxythreonine transaminase [Carnobacterium sp. AT7]EDP69073.1 phosphoserine aminotransferase [Carnobacterium sp. AT7]